MLHWKQKPKAILIARAIIKTLPNPFEIHSHAQIEFDSKLSFTRQCRKEAIKNETFVGSYKRTPSLATTFQSTLIYLQNFVLDF